MVFPKLTSLVLVVFALQNGIHGRVIVKRSAGLNSDFYTGYVDVNKTKDSASYHAAIAGQNHDIGNQQYFQQIVYINVASIEWDWNSFGGIAEIGAGLYRSCGRMKNIFSSGTKRDGGYNVEALAVRAEIGHGVVARVKITNAFVFTGPIGINVGVTADTGAFLRNKALEVKVLEALLGEIVFKFLYFLFWN